MAIAFPDLDPAAIRLGPLVIRWYALAYITGLVGGWKYVRWMVAKPPFAMQGEQVDDFLVWATLGTVLGGRLGYVLFYKPLYYLSAPADIFAVWQGGMSFHGGALGVFAAVFLFARRHHIGLGAMADAIAPAAPIGLFFGRIANFINGELYGRVAPDDLPWAVIFPGGGSLPRHPSQLYEAGLEGLLLFAVLGLVWRVEALRLRTGLLTGVFLLGYGLARVIAEFFRQPDAHLGFLWGGATMGQLLSLPFILAGGVVILRASRGP
ncbi:MAG TPA: prolipoprotein diacylglyceryl transferase [Rhodospirillaceae bacterium]|nr:prolipoprotein diacylglyceryl transferase [Rhodospirillaceae bacterium]